MKKAHVITVSDRCFAGSMRDSSGPALVRLLERGGFEVSGPEVVPDSRELILEAMMNAVSLDCDLIVTTGGTGLGPRDVTPQATRALVDYEVPGIGEEIRKVGASSTPMAMITRAMAGVRDHTLIINVPGGTRGATESLSAVMPVLNHAVQLLRGDTNHE